MENNKQIVSATSRYIRVAPSKIDVIIAKIRGKSYKEALQILKYLPPGLLFGKHYILQFQTQRIILI
jgi:ribosomal protein L22